MPCTRCGWEFDKNIDCYCSGCGRTLRELSLVNKERDQYTLFFGGSSCSLSIPIEYKGDHPIQITEPWEFLGLESLHATLGGSNSPLVEFSPNDQKNIEIQFDTSRYPFPQSGKLRIFAGICPPLDIGICCSPVPVFHFSVNEILVREGKAHIITGTPGKPELDFRIEVSRSPDAIWTQFRLYPEDSKETSFPVPAQLTFPVTINEGEPLEFSMRPDIGNYVRNAPTHLIAEFIFENCSPESFTIEVIEKAKIEHGQDLYLINENAFIRGRSGPRRIEITLKNSGGVEAEIIQVRPLSEPWLTIKSDPDKWNLEPYGGSESRFVILIDPFKIKEEAGKPDSLNGKISVSFKQIGGGQINEETLYVGVEVRPPVPLTYPVSIDFGNNSTCVAYTDPTNNEIKLVALENYAAQKIFEFPTIIEFDSFGDKGKETGEGFSYGYLLEKTKYVGGDNFRHRVWSFKRQLGIDTRAITRIDMKDKKSRSFTRKELCAFYLKEVFKRFEENSGCETDKIIITYPASFSPSQTKTLKEVTSIVKPDVQAITEISEPEALAIRHLRDRHLDKPVTIFAVFDFGGGTTDISIGRVSTKGGRQTISMIVSIGLDQLGGDILTFDLAKNIYEKACSLFKDPHRLFPEEFNDIFNLSLSEEKKLYNFMNVMKQAEDLKTNQDGRLDSLFANGEISINFHEFYSRRNDGAKPCILKYTSHDFTGIAGEQIRAGLKKLRGILEHLKKFEVIEEGQSLDLLILGGNSSRLPLVKDLCKEVLELPEENILFDPQIAKTAVAEGAAYYGRLRIDPNPDIIFDNSRHLKFPLGVCTGDMFEVLFSAGSKIGKETKRVWPLDSREPSLTIYRNFDPSDLHCVGNPNIEIAATHELKPYRNGKASRVNFRFKLVDKGIEISTERKNDLIEIEW